MPEIQRRLFRERSSALAAAGARARALWSRHALPPGDLIAIDREERLDRKLLLERAARFGPIFKALADDRLLVCVVGLPLGRRLLKAHANALRPVTLQLDSLFPLGFLRQMEGEAHRNLRRAVVRGVNAIDAAAWIDELDAVTAGGLAALMQPGQPGQPAAHEYARALSGIATAMLLRVFFGARPQTGAFDRLVQGYTRLGPNGLLWNIGEKQAQAYAALRDELRSQAAAHAAVPDADFGRGLLARLGAHAALDDTVLGNLIYMVEMGRYDLRGLLRWISRYAAGQPQWLERIAAEDSATEDSATEDSATGGPRSLADAFVLETLRMDQSERLMRSVQRDIVFDGFLIPKGSMLRICLWEAHKASTSFPRPFVFDPSRFRFKGPDGDAFSPFGLDQHHCPFANISVQLGVVFLRALARRYRLRTASADAAVRGAYHWEPALDFSVTLQPREVPR